MVLPKGHYTVSAPSSKLLKKTKNIHILGQYQLKSPCRSWAMTNTPDSDSFKQKVALQWSTSTEIATLWNANLIMDTGYISKIIKILTYTTGKVKKGREQDLTHTQTQQFSLWFIILFSVLVQLTHRETDNVISEIAWFRTGLFGKVVCLYKAELNQNPCET